MAEFTTFIEQFSDILWNSLLLFLLVGTGIYFTVRLRGVQIRRFGEGVHRVFGGFTLRGKKADADGMSSFQALTTAIAAQVGTGSFVPFPGSSSITIFATSEILKKFWLGS